MSDDLVFFSDEEESGKKREDDFKWRLLIVDDEEDIHSITKMVLKNYTFNGRDLEIISAYSGKEAIELMKREKDIALILMDVVMESDDAGLRCVETIREELNNYDTRIILRTGQPGQAPEDRVIIDYDINDYKEKSELTSSKLFTSITTSLRSYKYIDTINRNKKGLEKIIEASSNLFGIKSFRVFANGILEQLTAILDLDDNSMYLNTSSFTAYSDEESIDLNVLAATGEFSAYLDNPLNESCNKEIYYKLKEAIDREECIFGDNSFIGYYRSMNEEVTLLYFQWHRTLSKMERDLISIFSSNIAIAFENISLNKEILDTQKEIIHTMSEVVEGKSKETHDHIERVSLISELIAKKLNLSPSEVETIKLASPMHDIGKVSVSDSILNKPDKLSDSEYEVIKKHPIIGYEIFKKSKREIIKAAAVIAYEHHEKYDGTGYPRGIKGNEIHIFGRIVALVDVIDALYNKRCYKEPWTLDQVMEYIEKEKGKHFDPGVVDAFNSIKDEFIKISRENS